MTNPTTDTLVWQSGPDDQSWRHRRPVIFVADDEPTDQELLLRALQRLPEKCDVHIFSDGAELLESLAGATGLRSTGFHPVPDLIILDLKMPRKDGREALRVIGGELRMTTPVVIFSTSDDPNDVAECYKLGCNSYVAKPIDLYRFNEAVHMIVTYWLRLSRLPYPQHPRPLSIGQ